MIRTHVGSITDAELGADIIVNACNPTVAMGTGVSGAIQKACGGINFQRHVRLVWEDEFDEPLESSDCLVTDAGTATEFDWVLHVASVNYRVRDPETGGASGPSRIRACLIAALDEAAQLVSEKKLKDLAVGTPLLGAGHGGVGTTVSAAAMMEAIVKWGETREWIFSEIVFATPLPSDARLVRLAAERYGLL